MLATRAIVIFCLLLASFSVVCLATLPVFAQGTRLEDRTDSRSEAKEHSGKPPKSGKRTVWNLDGGVFFATDGHLQNGSCFRLSGQLTAPDFFDGLRRVDTDEGSSYFAHDKPVTEYPQQVQVIVHLLDFPCSLDLKDFKARPPLTREIMSTLRLNFYWKEGMHMHAVEDSKRIGADVRRIASHVAGPVAAEELAPRFEWNYAFTVESAHVPLTDDLVLVIENKEHKVAARVAARL